MGQDWTPTTEQRSLLDRIFGPCPPPFALLHRPVSGSEDHVDVLVGHVVRVTALADVPLPDDTGPRPDQPTYDALALVPYRQIVERGFECRDDGEPIRVLRITERVTLPLEAVLSELPRGPLSVGDTGFDVSDDDYADTVRDVIEQEIGRGAGSNFVVKRDFVASVSEPPATAALVLFGRLLERELGAYWTFVAHTGDRTFVGATPERHLTLDHGTVVMNPISGTYRYPASGPTVPGVLDFLLDRKETEELHMVVDEELKMMARVCDAGGRVRGPYLKEMAQLAHTEYLLEGRSSLDVRDLIRATMFAPTVTGSPIENACRVLARHETVGRRYYSGIVALVGRDETGGRTLDSAILIRTADIDSDGTMRVGVGATLVRHSDPDSEVEETRAKAAALLQAAGVEPARTPARVDHTFARGMISAHPAVRSTLARRNSTLAAFWFRSPESREAPDPLLLGVNALVVDAEDTFTRMLAHQLRAVGPRVRLVDWRDVASHPETVDLFDVVVLGPGPGDPRDHRDPRISTIRLLTERLLDRGTPILSVCLSHQVLAAILGLRLLRKDLPSQGLQREIDLFGSRRVVGFYNTYTAVSSRDGLPQPRVRAIVEVSRDRHTGEVHALRGPNFASVQFHPESVLTQDGPQLLTELLRWTLDRSPAGRIAGAGAGRAASSRIAG